jgi:N-acetylmuramoyl-L-alanine amidase
MVIRENNLPSTLMENGYHTNDANRALLSDPAFLDALALAYADTIEVYFAETALLSNAAQGR